jgi:hypothetical protein
MMNWNFGQYNRSRLNPPASTAVFYANESSKEKP